VSSVVRQIELGMLARMRLNAQPAGITIESYGAQLDDETFGWLRTVPAQWVTFDAITNVQKKGRNTWLYTGSFEVLSAQRHLQENARRLNGEAADQDIGAYELVERAKLLLAGQMLGLAIQPIEPGNVRSVMKGMANRDAVAVYAQQFSTQWLEVLPPEELTPPGELVSVGLNFLIKPGDENTDTSDLVTTQNP
jgi:phage gp37-like protein